MSSLTEYRRSGSELEPPVWETTPLHMNGTDADNAQLAAATWLRLSGDVLRGLTHTLGNRVHATDMMLGTMIVGDEVNEETVMFLNKESASCAELVRLYRLLNFAGSATNEACRVADVIPDAIALWQHHADRGGEQWVVQMREDTAPVLAPPIALTQALLILLLAHTEHASTASDAPTLDIHSENDWIVADFSSAADESELTSARAAATWMLRQAHASVTGRSTGNGRSATNLRLPSLAYARKLEKGERETN